MNTFSNYRLEIQPLAGQSPQECVDQLCEHFADFVVHYNGALGRGVGHPQFDGRIVRLHDGQRLLASRYGCSEHDLATADWEISLPDDRYCAWRITCAFAADKRGVEFQFRAEMGINTLLLPLSIRELKVQPGLVIPTEFLSAVLGRWKATIDGWPVPVAVELLNAREVETFVRGILLNPQRALPVIVLAADGRFKATPAAMQNLQRHLLGAAHVAALMSPAATEGLARSLNPELACSTGVLRVYYPTLTRESLPRHHPVFQAKDLLKKKLEPLLHKEAMRILVQRLPDGPITRAARAAAYRAATAIREQLPATLTRLAAAEKALRSAESQRDHLRAERDKARQALRSSEGKWTELMRTASAQAGELKAARTRLDACEGEAAMLRTEREESLELVRERERSLVHMRHDLDVVRQELAAQSPPTGAGELEEELARAWEENDRCLAALEAARREIETLKTDLAVSKENLDVLAAGPTVKRVHPTESPSAGRSLPLPTSVAEALQFASERHGDVLEIWDDAWRSAKASHFPGPTRVGEALQAIAEVGRSYFAALREGQSLGPLDHAFRAKVPFKYAPGESHVTMAMYGHERHFHSGDRRREIQRHLTLGGGSNCLQLYFDFDETHHKVIVAYCGRHLSHFSQTR